MRVFKLMPTVFIGALATAATAASAQTPNVLRVGPSTGRIFRNFDEPRAVIGVSTTGGATNRDTLGVLVSSVRSGSPAEKAGIEEGNRIASVNGVSLKLNAADVGDADMAEAMTRRLTRELNKLKPGDEIDLRVIAGNQTKALKIKTVASEDLRAAAARRADEERATLGLEIMTTGNARDSLGVLVMGIDDNGPAAKAGIEEGARIASINGVDLRETSHENEDDVFYRARNVSRLEREMQKVKPGDDVDLRVYFNGQYRTLKLKSAKASDLPRHGRTMTIMRDDQFLPRTMLAPNVIEMRAPEIAGTVQRLMKQMPMVVGFGNRVSW
jgi:S1-C subfamily serine protease